MAAIPDLSVLKKLSLEQLQQTADDIRQKIISTCLANGGHLGASLGAVEIALALHAVFDSPRDAMVWDVGHQAYAHKLLTGREERFKSLRKFGGISGFLSREESEHDIFGAGHSSTALSAGLGIAWAKGQAKKEDWTIAIIGDGGLTAGLAFEALNNAQTQPSGPFLVLLNDNQMSISKNVGAVPALLSGGNAREFFGLFGFDYAGPIDGHDLAQLIGTLRGIREARAENPSAAPVVLHVLTQKGKGYTPAEENPGSYHGVSAVSAAAAPAKKSFSEAFGEVLCRAAEKDPRIVAITAAMPDGTGLIPFSEKFPERFFDVGIAESHAVTFAAGLATQGVRPVVAIYSTFLQRALDSVIHDVALQKLPVIFAIDRAGLVGADGPTHHGVFDIAYLGMIPGMKIFAPETLKDIESCFNLALKSGGPVAIRYPRGSGSESSDAAIENGLRWRLRSASPKAVAISIGASGAKVGVATEKLGPDLRANLSWISTIQLKPIPNELERYLARYPDAKLLVVEDGTVHGGFGQQLGRQAELLGYPDRFIPHGSVSELEAAEHVAASDIEKKLKALLTS